MKAFVTNKISWTLPDDAHLTIKFLGDVDADKVPIVEKVLEEACARQPAFEITSKEVNIFGKFHTPSIVWYGFKRSKQLDDIHNKIEDLLVENDFLVVTKPFRPHLTIARFKESVQANIVKRQLMKNRINKPDQITVNKIVLFESELSPKGPVYTALKTVNLE